MSANSSTRLTRAGRGGATLVGVALLVGACGSDEGADGPGSSVEPVDSTAPDTTVVTDDAVDLDAIRDELDALEYESETIDGVAVLGNQPLADAADDSAGTTQQIDPNQEQVEGDFEPCPEEGPCEDEPPIEQGPPPTEPPPFVPDQEWAPFCTVLAELEDRPFPTDDLEALRTVDLWFGLLEPYVPDVIAADFAVLDEALDEAVRSQDIGILETSTDEMDRAADRIGEGVDAGCSGRGDLADLEADPGPVTPPPPPPDDVDVVTIVIEEGPDGPVVPIVEFESAPRDDPPPYLGSGGEPADGHQVRGADSAFCESVAIINDRPQPSDGLEQLAVGIAYVEALLPLTPDEIAPSLNEVAQGARRLLANGETSFDEPGEGDPGPEVAFQIVGEFVDERCLGR